MTPFAQRFSAYLAGSVARRIVGAAGLIAVLTAASRLVAVARDMILAAQFGLGGTLDALFIVLTLYQFVQSVFLVALSGAFIPTFAAVRLDEGEAAADRLWRDSAGRALLLFVALAVIVAGAAPLYLPLIAGGLGPDLALANRLVLLLAPFLVLSGAIALLGAVINTDRKFALPALTPAINSAIAIMLLLWQGERFGVAALAAGMTLGTAIETVVLARAVRRRGLSLRPRVATPAHPKVHDVRREYVASIAGTAMLAASVLVSQAMASGLGDRAVSALNLGGRVVFFVVLLVGTSLSTATIAHASDLAARGRTDELLPLADRFARWIMLATLPAGALLILLAEPLMRLVYQRGAFSSADTDLVAGVHSALVLQLPFYLANGMLVRMVAAAKANELLFQGAAISLAVTVAANYVLMQIWGVVGIAAAAAFAHLALFAFLRWRLAVTLRQRHA